MLSVTLAMAAKIVKAFTLCSLAHFLVSVIFLLATGVSLVPAVPWISSTGRLTYV
jgi:hypothetical protein